MNEGLLLPIAVCAGSLVLTLIALRSPTPSLGLPFAYQASLLLQHAPGAYAHYRRPELFFATSGFVEAGIWHTAVASVSFLIGTSAARSMRNVDRLGSGSMSVIPFQGLAAKFPYFCLIGGWTLNFGLAPLKSISSVGALIEKGGALWMLGVMLGLSRAIANRDLRSGVMWFSALAVYPSVMLLLGGFLSYGSAAAIIILSLLVITSRSLPRVLLGVVGMIILGLSIFVNYYTARDRIRELAWSQDAPMSERLQTVLDVFLDMSVIDLDNDRHAVAFDERLNQNYFAGLAASRIESGDVGFQGWTSFYEALAAPIPRMLWPDKPVSAGSGSKVRDMTGLPLSEFTSWGVGQVMEFYITYGWVSLIGGFLVLGFIIGSLDVRAGVALREGDARALFVCFLPAVALTQPIGSLVDIVSGAAASYVAAVLWFKVWLYWASGRVRRVTRT